jgi:hypothetical protein
MGNRASEQADAVAALLVDPRCEKLLCLGNCTSSYPTVESTLRTMCRRGVKAVADLLRNAPAGHVDGLGTLIYCLQMLEDHVVQVLTRHSSRHFYFLRMNACDALLSLTSLVISRVDCYARVGEDTMALYE